MKLKSLFTLATCLLWTFATAEFTFPEFLGADAQAVQNILPMNFTVSPIAGKAHMKQSSLDQSGWIYGIKGNFDMISTNALYVGGELGYKTGQISGKRVLVADLPRQTSAILLNPVTEDGIVVVPVVPVIDPTVTLKSNYSDMWLEARVGVTAGLTNGYVCPYVLIGYEKEKDDFSASDLLNANHSLSYGCFGFGVTSKVGMGGDLSVGVNSKIKWIFNSVSKVGNNSEITNSTFSGWSNFHWMIEIPVEYKIAPNMTVAVAPSYEYKTYGDDKNPWMGVEKPSFNMWGGKMQVSYAY